MSYVERTLLPNEKVVYQSRLHWFRYLQCVMLAAAGAALINYGIDTPLLVLLGGAFICAAPVLMAKAWLDQISSEFVVTETRVLIKSGFIRRRTLELMITRVESIGVDQSILGRLFGFGTIVVSGTGGTRERFRDLDDPLEFRWHVQAVAAGDLDGIRRRKAEGDSAQGSRLSKTMDNRLKLVVLSLFAIVAFTGFLYLATGGSEEPTTLVHKPSIRPLPGMPQSPQTVTSPPDPPANYMEPRGQTMASQVPDYDVTGYCSTIGNIAGGSYMVEKTCRDQEAAARAAVERMAIPARVASYCIDLARSGGGSYRIYQTCAEQEMRAAAQM